MPAKITDHSYTDFNTSTLIMSLAIASQQNRDSPCVPSVSLVAGMDDNPFDFKVLAVFMYRVLQRTNHPVSD